MTEKTKKLEKKWREVLTDEQFHILREKGTERAFTGQYWNHFEKGKYSCAGCGKELFNSDSKFESDCGWPSFAHPSIEEHIETEQDISFRMIRTEVLCSNCGGHLGHVFNDGPKEMGGLRYCINSASLKFHQEAKILKQEIFHRLSNLS